jgi:arylsulfatase A-like enzyme
VRVPLLIRFPESHPGSHPGRRIDELVRTVDVFPTLLDALGLPAPTGLDGVSLLPAVAGDAPPELWAYAETGRSFMGVDPEREVAGIPGKHRMIRTAKWKLVHRPGNEDEFRLFDLVRDPNERIDVAAANPDVVERLRAHLAEIIASEVPRDERELSVDEIEKLRELGYVQ